jgi:antitoxin HicB
MEMNSDMKKKDIKYYMSLQYRINLRPLSDDDGGGWLAEAIELPGCVSDGDSPAEAIQNLESAKEAWITTALAKGMFISEPQIESEPEYNGRITMRFPKSLHRKTAEAAKNEGMSLNAYLIYLISENHTAAMASKALNVCQRLVERREDSFTVVQDQLWNFNGEPETMGLYGGVTIAARRQ